MQIGYALPLVKGARAALEQAELLATLGYDYVELPLAGFDLSGHEGLEIAKRCVADTAIPTAVLQSFMPASIRLTGPNVDATGIKTYLGRAAEVCHAAGARAAVFGAAWSRNVPDGWSRDIARDQLVEAFAWTADAFEGCGTIVCIEPQNVKEANIIRFVDEAVGYAKAVNRSNIKVVVDFYHLDEERIPLSDISRFGDWIYHFQTADSGRNFPGSGHYDYAAFARELRAIGYDETVSVEVMRQLTPDMMRKSLDFLRGLWPAPALPGRQAGR
jgi:sugar phosphate isomerase/epimerase